jgi:Ca2+-transporting ATPase
MGGRGKKVIEIAVGKRACTFDPMEKTLHKGIRKQQQMTRRQFSMIHEYPLDGKPPMMTHVFENKEGKRLCC